MPLVSDVGAGANPPVSVYAEMNSSTPLGLAGTVLQLVQSAAMDLGNALPETQWTQLGTPIMTCASVAVGVLNTREVALYDGKIQCGAQLHADVTVGIVRECSIEHDVTGHTDPARVGPIALQMDKDSETLSLAASGMPGQTTGASIQYSVEGGLAVVSMLVTSEVVVW